MNTGTGALVRLGLRRDRIMLPIWIYVFAALTIATAASFKSLYPTVASRVAFGASLEHNPGLKAFTGPTFDLSTIGGLTAWRLGSLGGILIGLMVVFSVVRHTRAEEEAGRLELLGSAVVGRHAPLTAALLGALGASLGIGVIATVGLVIMDQPVAGSVAFGLAVVGVGAVFAGVAAVAAQLTETSRAANGLGVTVLGVAYVLRAIGDSAGPGGETWLSWVSPIGWGQQVRPFAGERWWVLALLFGLAAALVAAAYALVARRDLGAGLLPPRPGPARAAAGLRGPLSLAWRLHRGATIGWLAGFLVLGAAFGGIAEDMATLANTSAQLKRIFDELGGSRGLVDSFLSSILGLLGLVAAAFTVQAVLRLRSEEANQRAEPLLATRTSRAGLAASHLLVGLVGGALLLVAAGIVAGLAHGLRTGDVGGELPRVLVGAVVQIPAAWTLAGIALAAIGLLPRLASALSWGALVVFVLLGQLGPILHAPQWIMDVSPFTHVPKLPGGVVTGAPIGWLLVAGILGIVVGFAGFRRRDIG